jgi:hypothetical protein
MLAAERGRRFTPVLAAGRVGWSQSDALQLAAEITELAADL